MCPHRSQFEERHARHVAARCIDAVVKGLCESGRAYSKQASVWEHMSGALDPALHFTTCETLEKAT